MLLLDVLEVKLIEALAHFNDLLLFDVCKTSFVFELVKLGQLVPLKSLLLVELLLHVVSLVTKNFDLVF